MATLPREMLDALRAAGRTDADQNEAVDVLAVQEAAPGLVDLREGDPPLDWVEGVVDLLEALEPGEREEWDHLRGALRTFSLVSVGGAWGGGGADASDLFDLCELAELATICGQANRCAPRARDLVGRFFLKSIEQGAFFRDVRMTPAHFDELVALATPYLTVGTRGPAAIPPRWGFFAVLFWLAQGGRQRVVARAVDVAESTFCKFCTPVVEALRRALPAPAWPDKHERKKIGLDFSRLTGGNHAA